MKSLTCRITSIILILTILISCDKPDSENIGSPAMRGSFVGNFESIESMGRQIGPNYYSMCKASLEGFESIKNDLSPDQFDNYLGICQALRHYVEIIEKEPTAEVARAADEELVIHLNFMRSGSIYFQRWLNARRKIPEGRPNANR